MITNTRQAWTAGLTKLSPIEAQALMAAQEEAAARATYRAMAKAANDGSAA